MGKIKKKMMSSLKWSLFWYIPICAILAYLGAYTIGISTNELQYWYAKKYSDIEFYPHDERFEITTDEDGVMHYYFYDKTPYESKQVSHRIFYAIISYAQVLLIPAWVLLCVVITGVIFYKRELEKPIVTLMRASKKIEENCLDFHIESDKQNELGQLCQSFENMRTALYQQNKKTWRMLEERKRLNAAFSHDMRTPITVLKGYTDLLTRHISDGRISEEKLMEILGMMSGQITRLERYTHKMGAVQKLEDITPEPVLVSFLDFENKCKSISDIFKENYQVQLISRSELEYIKVDEELVLEVYENLLSNAIRYARNEVCIEVTVQDGVLQISVEDDGKGFSEEALRSAVKPFYREEDEKESNHFGLGLYICKMICEKCQGDLSIKNGGKVSAKFDTKSPIEANQGG